MLNVDCYWLFEYYKNRVPSAWICSGCGGRTRSTLHIAASPMASNTSVKQTVINDKRRRWCIIVEVTPEWCDDGGNVNPWVDICLHHGDDRHTVFDIVDQRVRTVHDSAQNVAIIFYFFVYTLTSNCNYMICSWPDMSMCDCEPKHISGWGYILMTCSHCWRCWNTLYIYKEDLLWVWTGCGVSITSTNIDS